MKTLLINPANLRLSPFVQTYLNVESEKVTLISWDRLGLNEEPGPYYQDNKKNIKRTFFDYMKFFNFVKNHINNNNYAKVVIFGIETLYFMRRFLIKNKLKYIVDIRDDHKLRRFFRINKYLNHSEFIVVSSKKYQNLYKADVNTYINHNIGNFDINDHEQKAPTASSKKIKINYIGSPRDLNINKIIIDKLSNNGEIILGYIGYGNLESTLVSHVEKNEINNVIFKGVYSRKDEPVLYNNSTLINVLRFPDSKNNIYALPNRLYLAAFYSKPLLALKGTYLADIIDEYGLGLVIKDFDNIDEKIKKYLSEFSQDKFNKRTKFFLSKVLLENKKTVKKINEFILY